MPKLKNPSLWKKSFNKAVKELDGFSALDSQKLEGKDQEQIRSISTAYFDELKAKAKNLAEGLIKTNASELEEELACELLNALDWKYLEIADSQGVRMSVQVKRT